MLEELGLDYRLIFLDLGTNAQKSEEHTKYNPNGRIPTLIDHKNNDFSIWYVFRSLFVTMLTKWVAHRRESDAIIVYLIEKYDPEHKLSFEKFEDRMQQLQWLLFQASGQG